MLQATHIFVKQYCARIQRCRSFSGNGLRASQNLENWAFICEYKGLFSQGEEAKALFNNKESDNVYLFFYTDHRTSIFHSVDASDTKNDQKVSLRIVRRERTVRIGEEEQRRRHISSYTQLCRDNVVRGDEGAGVVGRGLRANQQLTKWAFVCEYKGQRTHGEEAEEQKSNPQNTYLFFYEDYECPRVWHCVDASDTVNLKCGLLNHSRRSPNCKMILHGRGDTLRPIIIAIRPIEVGEELLWDYGERNSEIIAKFPWLRYS